MHLSLDLALSLSSGTTPCFLQPTVSWDPIIPPLPSSLLSQERFHPPSDWHFRLVNVFLDLQTLSFRINHIISTHARYNGAYFQEVLTTLQSRLMYLKTKSPVEELVRLTLLAFLATTVKIPKRRISYDWLIKQLRETYAKAERDPADLAPSLKVWVLMGAGLSVTGAPEEWIRHGWSKIATRGQNWEDVKSHLMKIMWIESIHDGPGKLVFTHLKDGNVKSRNSVGYALRA